MAFKKKHPKMNLIFSIKDEMAGASGRVIVNLPERENLKRGIRRNRAKNVSPNPKSLEQLQKIPEFNNFL